MFNIFKKEELKPTIIDYLIKTEYFEFTDLYKLDELKSKIQYSYDMFGTFTTTYDINNKPNCRKNFFCDSETLFEGWGFKSQLEEMKEGFTKITNFDHLKNQIPESYDYTTNPEGSWSDAVVDFINRVNKYLTDSGSKYQCYPVYSGNEGRICLLNDVQFFLLNTLIKDELTKPIRLKDWIDKYNPNSNPKVIKPNELKTELKEGMHVKHLKFGIGQIIEISDRGLANIRFKDGDRNIILQFANLEII